MESVSQRFPRRVYLTKFDGTKRNDTWHKPSVGENSAHSFILHLFSLALFTVGERTDKRKPPEDFFREGFVCFILNNLLTSYFLRGDGVYEALLLQSV